MKIEAIKLNDTHEKILVDGEVFLKRVKIGRWNYVPELFTKNDAGEWEQLCYGKSATREAAEKWQPYPMRRWIDLVAGGRPVPTATPEAVAEFKDRFPNWTKETRRSVYGSVTRLVAPIEYKTKVHKINRDYEAGL